MGFGPIPVQGPVKMDGLGGGAFLRSFAACAAAERSVPACSTVSGLSPAVRLLTYWLSSARSLASFSSSSWLSSDCAPGTIDGVSPPPPLGLCPHAGPLAAPTIATVTINALSARKPRLPIRSPLVNKADVYSRTAKRAARPKASVRPSHHHPAAQRLNRWPCPRPSG